MNNDESVNFLLVIFGFALVWVLLWVAALGGMVMGHHGAATQLFVAGGGVGCFTMFLLKLLRLFDSRSHD